MMRTRYLLSLIIMIVLGTTTGCIGPENRIRKLALLAQKGDQEAFQALITSLNDKGFFVQTNTAIALGALKDPRAVEPLIAVLKDKRELVRRYVAWALKQITGKSFGVDVEEWKKWWEKNKPRK